MQCLKVSGAVRPIYGLLRGKRLIVATYVHLNGRVGKYTKVLRRGHNAV